MNRQRLNTASLYWLLAALSVTVASHTLNVPIWLLTISAAIILYRFFIQKNGWPMPTRWQILPVTICLCFGISWNFAGFFGRDASLSLLVVMASLKLLETKMMRDYMLVVVLGYFLVGNLFMFNQSIFTFLISVPPLILLTTALISVSSHQILDWRFLITFAGKMLLQAVPVMLILFVLFPRIPGPLWSIPQDANSGMTGLGDSLSFGNISHLTQNSAIAFRVQFKGQTPAKNLLYWRGPVLWHQDGNHWLMSSEKIGLADETLQTQGAPIDYTITLEPHNRLWLLMLDMPNATTGTKLTHDHSAVTNEPVRSRIRYNATAFTQYTLAETLGERERIFGLQITEGENERTKALANAWEGLSPEEKINKALAKFRNEKFVYTLSPPKLNIDAIDAFLFDTKRGFCEHYATSFVYLMRAAGVPARIVTGYQGGEQNGNYLIVRQSDAHAWAEVWLQNRGWVRVDPTAAVAPERIELGINDAISEIDQLPFMARKDYPWLHQATLNWDSVNNGWNQWVLGYDDKTQLNFLQALTGKKFSLSELAIWMTIVAAAVSCAMFFWLFKQTKVKLNAAQKLYSQHLKQLKQIGLTPKIGEPALDFAARAAAQLPEKHAQLLQIAECYNECQYSQHALHLHELHLGKLTQLIQAFSHKK